MQDFSKLLLEDPELARLWAEAEAKPPKEPPKIDYANLIRQLRQGNTIRCPECMFGKIIPKVSSGTRFHCNECNYTINLD